MTNKFIINISFFFNNTYFSFGKYNALTGRSIHTAYNTDTNYSEIVHDYSSFYFGVNTVTKFYIDTDEVRTYQKIIPIASSDNLTLGDATHAFRYLYLKDDNGVDRRVSINTSGVLTVT